MPEGKSIADRKKEPPPCLRLSVRWKFFIVFALLVAGTFAPLYFMTETILTRHLPGLIGSSLQSETAGVRNSQSAVEDARSRLRNRFLAAAGVFLAAAVFAGSRLRRPAVRDLQAMGQAARAYGSGEFSVAVPHSREDEIGDLGRALDDMRSRIGSTTQRLNEERDRLQEILGTMQDGVLMLDKDGTILMANPALREMLDFPAEPMGRRIFELIREPNLREMISEGLKADEPLVREMTLQRAGAERRVVVRLARVRRKGDPSGAVLVFQDVSETRRLEKMRSDFVANVSHELKTPLAAIRGYAETLTETPPRDPAQSKAFLATILKHAKRLESLVEDLLELSRIESGRAALSYESVSLGPCVKRVLQSVEPLARQRKLTLDASIPASFPALRVDPSAIETILSNLVDNAVKYAGDGGRVEVAASLADGQARIDVVDTGPGIPAEHLPRLFERFYRVDTSRSREQGGTGLGLAIVKHLCQALGGRVAVHSEPGRGSTFSVFLPVPEEG